MDNDRQTFSKRLRKLIRIKHITIRDLADKTGVSRNTVYGWLRGDQLPQLYYLWNLREAFSCSWEELLGP